MTKLKAIGAVILAAAGLAVACATTAGAAKTDEGPPWCFTQDGGSPTTVDYPGLKAYFGGHAPLLGEISQAADHGGNLWLDFTSNNEVFFTASPDSPPNSGDVVPTGSSGDTFTNIVHYTVANGACVSAGSTSTESTTTQPNTPPPTTTSTPPPTTTGVTTTSPAPTTTQTTPAQPAGPVAYICESGSQTDPNVETRKFAYRLWDVGNFVPYAVKGLYGHTRIGGGYSLICNPYHFKLHLTQKQWVNDNGAQVHYLDLGHYPVVSKKAPVATKHPKVLKKR